jgi:trans-aconitate methyltransferase
MRLAGRYPQAKVVGLDGADSMLDIARKAILRIPLWPIELMFENGISADKKIPCWEAFHAVVSNSLLHHT